MLKRARMHGIPSFLGTWALTFGWFPSSKFSSCMFVLLASKTCCFDCFMYLSSQSREPLAL